MNYGLYLSASGMLVNMHRQDVAANNLANASTVGFKRDLASFRARDAEAQLVGDMDAAHDLLDRLGGGVKLHQTRLSLNDGQISPTGNDMDVAIEGGGFFVVQDPANPGGFKLTRDGRFGTDGQGRLASGHGRLPVLDENGRTIAIDPTLPVLIQPDGRIVQGGAEVARLNLLDASGAGDLRHAGRGLYDVDAGVFQRNRRATGKIHQGFTERSNVDPVKEMMQLISATKAATGNGNLIRYHDQTMDRAVNVLGRVA